MCVVVGMQLHAQTVFNLVDSTSYGYANVLTSDTAYYTAGGGFNPSGSGSIILVKYDLEGNVTVVDTFSVDGVATYDVFLNTFNGKLLLPHTINSVYPFNGGTADVELSILNEDFSVISSNMFGGSIQETTVDLVTTDTAFYILGGTNSFGSGNGDYYLVITDTLGNLISEHTYGGNTLDYSMSMSLTKDNSVIMLGTREVNSPDYDLFLVKTDLNGTVVWEKQIGGNYNDYAGNLISLHDNSFLVTYSTNYGGYTRGYIQKLDGDANSIWSKEFSMNDFLSFGLVKPLESPDGTLLAVCTAKNPQGIPMIFYIN